VALVRVGPTAGATDGSVVVCAVVRTTRTGIFRLVDHAVRLATGDLQQAWVRVRDAIRTADGIHLTGADFWTDTDIPHVKGIARLTDGTISASGGAVLGQGDSRESEEQEGFGHYLERFLAFIGILGHKKTDKGFRAEPSQPSTSCKG
jgi:hypothetical protein